jgi:hypothetical protein
MTSRSRGLPEFLIITAIPVALAACSSGSSSLAAGSSSVASSSSGSSGVASGSAGAASGLGGGGGPAFCAAFGHASADVLYVANGTKKPGPVEDELEQVQRAAPADITSAVKLLTNVDIAYVDRDPNVGKMRVNPDYEAAQKSFYAWSTANCPRA